MRNPRFHDLLTHMGELHNSKNADYASDGNPYSNFEEAAQVAEGFSGVDAVFATLIGVKLARLRELTRAGKQPNHEGIQDTRTDLAMYAALWASYCAPTPNQEPLSYDDRRTGQPPCRCGRIFTHPERCEQTGKCQALRHPHAASG